MVPFSIVLPTKNRSHIVGSAIQSVLRQSFPDFELLLIDNDDTEQTAQVVQGFKDPRLRYFRTSGLSMADNWDFGMQQAQGDYVTILEDKQALRKKALETLQAFIRRHDPLLVTWPVSRVEHSFSNQVFLTRLGPNANSFIGKSPVDRGQCGVRQPRDILQEIVFRTPVYEHLGYIPRGLNSLSHHSLLHTIREGPAARVCLPIAPDYTLAYQQLALVDQVWNLGRPLSIYGNFSSNGFKARLKHDQQIIEFFKQIGGKEKAYSHTPIKAYINYNLIINEFLRLRELVGGKLLQADFPLTEYYYWCYWDIAISKALGVCMAEEEQAWRDSLFKQETAVQKTVLSRISPLRLKVRLLKAVSLGNRVDLIRLQYLLKRLFRTSPLFSNALQYLSWEEARHQDPLS